MAGPAPAVGYTRLRAGAGWLVFLALCLPAGTAPAAARLRAGAAAVAITPPLGVSLDGTISKPGPVKGVHDPLHARALVLDDGRLRVAIVVTDLTMIERAVCDQAKARIERQTGLPARRVLISAVHTHAAPRVRFGRRGPLDDRYYDFLVKQLSAAVAQGIDHLAPARIGWGALDQPEYVKCRRLLCQPGSVAPNPFGQSGERVKSVAGQSSAVIQPAGPVDPQVSVLSVQHADGRPLAVLANYSVHYCGGYQRGMVSADYFGYFARRLEEQLDAGPDHPPFVGIMTNGTSGDTGAIQSGGKRYRPFQWMEIAGRLLADQTLRVVRQIKHRADVTLAMDETDLQLAVRRPDPKRLAWARAVLADPEAPRPHRWTPIYAREALLLSQYPPTRPVQLQAIRVGQLGIAAVACEVFAETGLAIKKNSPFPSTFTISLANGAEGYLPPPQQHAWGGYETWPARSSCLEVQAEPKIRAAVLRLLTRTAAPP